MQDLVKEDASYVNLLRRATAVCFVALVFSYLAIVAFSVEQQYREQEALISLKIAQAKLISDPTDELSQILTDYQDASHRNRLELITLVTENADALAQISGSDEIINDRFFAQLFPQDEPVWATVLPGGRQELEVNGFLLTQFLSGTFSFLFVFLACLCVSVSVYLSKELSKAPAKKLTFEQLHQLIDQVQGSTISDKGFVVSNLVNAYIGSPNRLEPTTVVVGDEDSGEHGHETKKKLNSVLSSDGFARGIYNSLSLLPVVILGVVIGLGVPILFLWSYIKSNL